MTHTRTSVVLERVCLAKTNPQISLHPHMYEVNNNGEDQPPTEPQESVADNPHLEFLLKQIEYFPTLPEHIKYSYATNADLYDLMVIIANILK